MKKTASLLALACVIAMTGCTPKEEVTEEKTARTVQTAAVTTGDISSDFSFSGKVAASREVSVVPTIAGKVTGFGYEVGNSVGAGAVLFTVDSTDLQNNLRSVEANYDATKLQVDNAKTTLESISGVVTQRGVEIGSFASQSQPAYTILDVSSVKVEVGVSEQMVNEIAIGDTVNVLLTAVSPDPLQGKVSTISPSASQAGTYTVKITLDNSRGLLKPGMLAEVSFITDSSSNTMILPRDAVITKDGEVYVYVVENNIAKKVPVETGIESGENIEIISGLTPDMQVVVKGQTYITDGEEVNVSTPEEDVLRVPVEGAQVQSEGE